MHSIVQVHATNTHITIILQRYFPYFALVVLWLNSSGQSSQWRVQTSNTNSLRSLGDKVLLGPWSTENLFLEPGFLND